MKKFPARLLLVSDRNNDILWEPREVPLMKETLGISQRAELARRAMASPIDHSHCPTPPPPPPPPPPALCCMTCSIESPLMPPWEKWIYIGGAILVLSILGMLVWAASV